MQETRTFGDNLKEQMIRKNFTPTQLSRKSKYSLAAINSWLSGKTLPSLLAACQLSRVLKCHVEDLTKDIGYKDARRTEDEDNA